MGASKVPVHADVHELDEGMRRAVEQHQSPTSIARGTTTACLGSRDVVVHVSNGPSMRWRGRERPELHGVAADGALPATDGHGQPVLFPALEPTS